MTTLFLSENIKNRKEVANETGSLLSAEVSRLELKFGELESVLAEFKEKYLKLLPEITSINVNSPYSSRRKGDGGGKCSH